MSVPSGSTAEAVEKLADFWVSADQLQEAENRARGMAPIFHQMDSHAHHMAWEDPRQARPGAPFPHHQQQHQQWPAQGPLHINPGMVRDEGSNPSPMPHGGMGASRQQQHGSVVTGREVLGEGSFMGRGYSIKRCQGFVRCDMDIDAEVVGWVIGKNGESVTQVFVLPCVSSAESAGKSNTAVLVQDRRG